MYFEGKMCSEASSSTPGSSSTSVASTPSTTPGSPSTPATAYTAPFASASKTPGESSTPLTTALSSSSFLETFLTSPYETWDSPVLFKPEVSESTSSYPPTFLALIDYLLRAH